MMIGVDIRDGSRRPEADDCALLKEFGISRRQQFEHARGRRRLDGSCRSGRPDRDAK